MAVHFEKQDAYEKAGALVSVEEGMVADDSGGVGGSQVYSVGVFAIGVKLLRPGEGGFQKPFIANAHRSAVESEKSVMERESIAFVDPERFAHLASVCSVLR